MRQSSRDGDYVADHRAPTPLPGYDPQTGRKTWDPTTVHTWHTHCRATRHFSVAPHTHRPGQGARTDLTYLPDPDGHPMFISPTTITIATLLHDLTDPHGTTIPRSALQQWAQQFPNGNHTPLLSPPQKP